MIRKLAYPKIEKFLNQTAQSLNARGLSPNQLTLAGLAVNFLAGWVYASGHLFLAGLVVLIAALADLLDGPLARTSGRTSPFGAFLDSTVDRYSDFFIFGGLALYFAHESEEGLLILVLGILVGSFVTSYAKARAENFVEKCDAGIFERAERIIALALGSLFSPLLIPILWILFLGTNATAIERILHTRKLLAKSSATS